MARLGLVLLAVCVLLAGCSRERPAHPDKPFNQTSGNPLRWLLDALEQIGKRYPEVEDTDVREQTYAAIFHGYIEQTPGYVVPDKFGMFSDAADLEVKRALQAYIVGAIADAKVLNLDTPEKRFQSFENIHERSRGGKTYDDFFGSGETYAKVQGALNGSPKKN